MLKRLFYPSPSGRETSPKIDYQYTPNYLLPAEKQQWRRWAKDCKVIVAGNYPLGDPTWTKEKEKEPSYISVKIQGKDHRAKKILDNVGQCLGIELDNGEVRMLPAEAGLQGPQRIITTEQQQKFLQAGYRLIPAASEYGSTFVLAQDTGKNTRENDTIVRLTDGIEKPMKELSYAHEQFLIELKKLQDSEGRSLLEQRLKEWWGTNIEICLKRGESAILTGQIDPTSATARNVEIKTHFLVDTLQGLLPERLTTLPEQQQWLIALLMVSPQKLRNMLSLAAGNNKFTMKISLTEDETKVLYDVTNEVTQKKNVSRADVANSTVGIKLHTEFVVTPHIAAITSTTSADIEAPGVKIESTQFSLNDQDLLQERSLPEILEDVNQTFGEIIILEELKQYLSSEEVLNNESRKTAAQDILGKITSALEQQTTLLCKESVWEEEMGKIAESIVRCLAEDQKQHEQDLVSVASEFDVRLLQKIPPRVFEKVVDILVDGSEPLIEDEKQRSQQIAKRRDKIMQETQNMREVKSVQQSWFGGWTEKSGVAKILREYNIEQYKRSPAQIHTQG